MYANQDGNIQQNWRITGNKGWRSLYFLLIPFESGMDKKEEFQVILNTAASKAVKVLMQNYPASQLEPVSKKLRRVIENMVYKSNNKSIAIMVSPLVEKVYYFNYTPELSNSYKSV